MIAVKFDQLTLAVADKIIVQTFSADMSKGEFIGVFGANGSGKTSLLRAMLGLFQPRAGYIQIEGKIAKRGNPVIGYMPQLREQIAPGGLSGFEYLACSLNGFRWGFPVFNKQQTQHIHHIIRLIGVENYVHRPYRCLSGGERQRLSLAQALLDQPRILLLDEPLSGLDPGQQEKMLEVIHHVQKTLSITVLLTAHDFNPLLPLMNRLIYLASGKAAIGTVQDVVTSKTLSALYDSPVEVLKSHNRLFVIHHSSGSHLHDLFADTHHT